MRIEGKSSSSGNINELEIGSTGRASVDAVAISQRLHSAHHGDAYWIHSHYVSLTTTGSFSGIMYLKNTHSENNVHLSTVRTCCSEIGAFKWQAIKNPTAGTLITGGTSVTPVNSNFTSNRDMTATAIKGADGLDITDGEMMGTWTDGGPGHSVSEIDGTIILGPGDSIAIECQPSVATDVCTTWQVWVEGPHV